MLNTETFVRDLEQKLKADFEAARAGGRPLFGEEDGDREARTLSKLANLRLSPWQVLTDHQVAASIGLATGLLKRFRTRGDGPPCVPAGDDTVLYPAGELIFWLEADQPENSKGV
jgi:hypothetical protein